MLAAEKPWPDTSISANPPPMQKPITPILPVQSPSRASHERHASTSSNAGPDRSNQVASYSTDAAKHPTQIVKINGKCQEASRQANQPDCGLCSCHQHRAIRSPLDALSNLQAWQDSTASAPAVS